MQHQRERGKTEAAGSQWVTRRVKCRQSVCRGACVGMSVARARVPTEATETANNAHNSKTVDNVTDARLTWGILVGSSSKRTEKLEPPVTI